MRQNVSLHCRCDRTSHYTVDATDATQVTQRFNLTSDATEHHTPTKIAARLTPTADTTELDTPTKTATERLTTHRRCDTMSHLLL